MKYEKLNRKALSCMYVAAIVQFIITSIICGVLACMIKNNDNGLNKLGHLVFYLLIAAIILDFLSIVITPRIRYMRYRYLINEEEIDIREGIIIIKRDIVPIERIHKIEVIAGQIDRIFGLAKVKVTTAGGDVTVRFLENEKADFIAEALKKRINEVVKEEKELERVSAAKGEKVASDGTE